MRSIFSSVKIFIKLLQVNFDVKQIKNNLQQKRMNLTTIEITLYIQSVVVSKSVSDTLYFLCF